MRQIRQTFAAFVVRDFRFMWGGSLLSVTAFMTSFSLIPSVAYELTGSYAAAGIAMLGSGVSQTLLGPIGGVIADRYRKKPLVMAGQAMPGILLGALGFLIVTELISVPLLVVATLVMGAGFSLMGPARQAWTGFIVPRRLLPNAVALQQMSMNTGQVLGPTLIALFGLFMALEGGNTGILFLIVACFFAIVVPMTASIRTEGPATPPEDRRAMRVELAEGFNYLRKNPRLRLLWAFFLLIVSCGWGFQTLLPGVLAEEFGRNPTDVGPTFMIFGVSSLVVNILLAGAVSTRWAWPLLFIMGAVMAVGFWLVALAPTYPLFLILGAFIGAGRSGTMLVNQSVMMANTRPDYFGRVMSFAMMAFGFQALFGPVWGIIADAIGGPETMALIGVIAAGASVFMVVGWLKTRNLPLEPGTAAASMGRRMGPSPVRRPVPAAANGVAANGASGNGVGAIQPQPTFAAQLAPVALMDPQKQRS